MTGETSPPPDESIQPRRLRDRARRVAPYAAGALFVATAAVLIGGRSRHAPSQLPQMNAQLSPAGPGVRVGRSYVSPSESVRRPTHVVRPHVRGEGVRVNGYVRPRVRRGHESLSASQLAELVGRG
jgi:hypothetical protein